MQPFVYRDITEQDISNLFFVRVRTHENRLTREDLDTLGITDASVKDKLRGSYKGWLCEVNGRVAGFAMGDRSTGELWVIAVLPEFIGQGIGAELLGKVEDWLWNSGCAYAWLTTGVDPTLKAYGFYLRHGWADDRIEGGMRYMRKELP